MSKTNSTITDKLLRGIQSRGLRLKLLTQVGRSIPSEIITCINQVTHNYDSSSIQARVLTAKIMAAGLAADGEFECNDTEAWNLASTAWEHANATNNRDQMMQRLVRCVGQKLDLASPHIYSLAVYLINQGHKINFNRLYWDLVHWDDAQGTVRMAWASSFCQLHDDELQDVA